MSPPRTVLKQGTAMDPEPQTQGDARTRKHADMFNGYLSTELTKRHAKWVAPECRDCWCHFNCSNADRTDPEDAAALRARPKAGYLVGSDRFRRFGNPNLFRFLLGQSA
jgi:hypothetical protein